MVVTNDNKSSGRIRGKVYIKESRNQHHQCFHYLKNWPRSISYFSHCQSGILHK